jgi:hypothetical protein
MVTLAAVYLSLAAVRRGEVSGLAVDFEAVGKVILPIQIAIHGETGDRV